MMTILGRHMAGLVFGGMVAFALVGYPAEPKAASECTGSDKGDWRDETVRNSSDDMLPGVTNEYLRAWLQANDQTVQQKMYKAVCRTLQEAEISFVEEPANYTLLATITTDGLFHHLDMRVVVRDDTVKFYHALPIRISPDLRGEVAKLIAQLNSAFNCGAFEMNCVDTGEVRFRNVLPFEAIKYGGEKRVGELLLIGWLTIKSHDKILWAVCGGAMTFEEAWTKYVSNAIRDDDTKGNEDEKE